MGCPESFTEPLEIYHLALRRGMDAVTITDHNALEGCLEIAHLEKVITGCEYTAYFPEDRCKIHVLVYNLSEAHHADLLKARENIEDLVRYAQANDLPCACAHPLYSVNDRLTKAHIERLVLYFKNFEINGDIHADMNAVLRRKLQELNPGIVDEMANRHNMSPLCDEPWLKNIIGGSDDHCGLRLGKTYTEVDKAVNMKEFWEGVGNGQAGVRGEESSPHAFARNIYSIMHQFCKSRFGIDRYRNKDMFLQFLEKMLQNRPEATDPLWCRLSQTVSRLRKPLQPPTANASLLDLVRFEGDRLIRNDPQLMQFLSKGISPLQNLDEKWYDCVNQVSNRLLQHLGEDVIERVLKMRFLDLLQTLGSAGSLYLMLAPYFLGFSIRATQRKVCHELLGFSTTDGSGVKSPRVAHFTDTLHEINGVARTLRQQLASALRLGKDYTIVTVAADHQQYQRGVHYFSAVGTYDLPEYPEVKLFYPPFLQMLNHCYNEKYTHIHVSTPGPVSLTALAIARILHLPISGTYHTAIPQYAKVLTEDSHVEDLLWKYMIWFYDQMDYVYVPSMSTAKELTERGLNEEKIRIYPRGVDLERFHPDRRDAGIRARFNIPADATIMLYVGRISKEKGLALLGQAFQHLQAKYPDLYLIVAGDGPFRGEYEEMLRGLPVVFTGYLEGDDLPVLYASSDFLVFPSATDTFGNVVLEAHASGIPVIVSNQGGPKENTVHGETGLIIAAGNLDELVAAIQCFASDKMLCRSMGTAAREQVSQRSFTQQFEKLWNMYVSGSLQDNSPSSPFELMSSVIAESSMRAALAGGHA